MGLSRHELFLPTLAHPLPLQERVRRFRSVSSLEKIMSEKKIINIGIALNEAGQIADPTAGDPQSGTYWENILRRVDRHVDFITLDDHFGSGEQGFDATLLASRLGPLAQQTGIIPAVTVNYNEPFHVSTTIATIDYVTRGRAGLLAKLPPPAEAADISRVIGSLPGFPAAETADLQEDASDALEVIRQLWDSWEDNAIIRDPVSQRFVDGEKLHYINFRGKRFSVLGPSIVPRPPQGQPVIAASAGTDRELEFAAGTADLVFLRPGASAVGEFIEKARAAANRTGRHVKYILDIDVHFDAQDRNDTTATRWNGQASALAEQIREWVAQGFDGMRLIPLDLDRDLAGLTEVVFPALADAGLLPSGRAPSLRTRLGLPEAQNRYSRVA